MSPDRTDILTVTQINSQVRWLIEDNFPEVRVLGEVSNFKRHSSGHLYMTLKDSNAQLSMVCFKQDAEKFDFELEDGMQLVATGRLTVYEPYGRYQLVARTVEKAGVGELELAFRKLCEKLEKEGLFAPEHKKPLPAYPFKIAVVTSPTGAAVRDIITTLRRRWPCVEIILFPVNVQGDHAVGDMLRALEIIPRMEGIDLAIIGRGGGSLEDLWAFNDERLARAIFNFDIPVISAVGHETDSTICDFVADKRAATPTMAAEVAVPVKEEVEAKIGDAGAKLGRLITEKIRYYSTRLLALTRSYGLGRVRGQIETSIQRLDFAIDKLVKTAGVLLEAKRSRLERVVAALESLSPRAVLRRGYALCSYIDTGKLLSTAASALEAGRMTVTFSDGGVRADVKEKSNEQDKR